MQSGSRNQDQCQNAAAQSEQASENGVASTTDDHGERHAARLEADLAATRRLYQLQSKLAVETDLKAALGDIVAAAADFTGTDRGCVQLVSEDGERLQMFVHRGHGPESGFIRHFLDAGSKPACDAARQDQRRTIIDDVATFPALLWTEDRRIALAEDIRATQSTPMISRKGELVGVLSTQFRQPHRPSDDELQLIDMLAWTAADFVDRHLTEAALRHADDERHRKTLEIDTVPVVFFDLMGGITDANDAFLELIGYTRAELDAGDVRYEALTPSDWAWRDAQTVAELRATGKSKPFEKEYLRRDGSRIWIHCTGRMLDQQTAIEFIIDITERKRAEQALRASDQRQAFLLALSDALRPLADPVEVQDVASRVLGEHLESDRTYYCWIDRTTELCTVERDYVRGGAPSVVGRYPFSAAGPLLDAMGHGRPFVAADIEAAPDLPEGDRPFFRGLAIRAFVCTPIIKNGELVACMAVSNIAPRAWTPQEVALIGGVAERTWEAVERARTETALRASEERFRSFAETSTDALWIADAESGQLEYLSPAYERIWGEPRDAVMAHIGHWASRLHSDDRIKASEGFQVLRTGQRLNLEYRIVRPDGTVRYIHDAGFPIVDGGKVRRLAGVAQDLTERRLAERALAESERRARSLVEGVPQLVWRAVDVGQWTWASPQWTAFTGQTEQASRGRGWLAAVHPDDHEAVMAAWDRAADAGGFDVECRIRRSDGEPLWFATRATPVRDDQGTILEWLGTSTEIHAMRELQARQGVLVAELQHRTRNLIAIVRSLAGKTGTEATSLDDFQERFGSRLSALSRVQGLLSQLTAGQRVSFDELVASELGAMGTARDKVTIDGPPGVLLRSATVQTFALVLHELATNAVKYGALCAAAGHLTIRWRVEADGPGRRLRVDWRETGVAMPPDAASPQGSGYGRELIERALPYQLKAKTTYDLGADGVHCTIVVPIPSDGVEAES